MDQIAPHPHKKKGAGPFFFPLHCNRIAWVFTPMLSESVNHTVFCEPFWGVINIDTHYGLHERDFNAIWEIHRIC